MKEIIPRECIMEFAVDMEKKLRVNDGVKPDWREQENSELLNHLKQEVDELSDEFDSEPPVIGLARYEATDVALIAMMLWDKLVPGERGNGR